MLAFTAMHLPRQGKAPQGTCHATRECAVVPWGTLEHVQR